MNTTEQFSLLDENGRQIPVDLPRGNWVDSIHKGVLIDDTGSAIDMVQTDTVHVLDFLQDAPIIWDLSVTFTGLEIEALITQVGISLGLVLNHTAAELTAQQIVVPDNANQGAYQQITGETVTNGVPVSGFVGVATIPDVGAAGQAIKGSGSIRAYSQAKINYGLCWSSIGEREAGTTTPAVNAYLLESDYTQAMKDAGNLVAIGGAAYKIVGLISIEPVA